MLIKQSGEIILASSSKIRRQILTEMGLCFKAISPDFDEEKAKSSLDLSPKNLSVHLAKEKALSISRKNNNVYVIGSDQVCSLDEIELTKSKNSLDATNQLKKLSGKIHYQNNAVVICLNGEIIFENFSKAKLAMRKLTIEEIKSYVKEDKPIGCAGSYKYEALGKHLFESVEGDYYAILGLAIQPLLNFLYKKNILEL